MAKHDENRDIRSVSRIAKVNSIDKSIQAPKTAVIGIHMWGKIDYLTNYCGYHFYWNNSVSPTNISNSTSTSAGWIASLFDPSVHFLLTEMFIFSTL